MKLISFSVSNYRSITRAHKIQLHDLTILVGKNNEGKSNIIKALSLSMKIIKKYNFISGRHGITKGILSRYYEDMLDYKWERDFPIASQNKSSGKKITRFEMEFQLTEDERKKLNKKTGMRLNTPNFDITIEIGENNIPNIKALKKGSSKIKNNSSTISEFITNNLVFNYIPAIRTESQAIELIRDTLDQELRTVEEDPEYIKAIETISKLQKSPLDNIAKKVKATLMDFIPSINDVKIEIEESSRKYSLRRSVDVYIDDGVLTNIEYKGDGIKSLATLAMLTDRYNVEQSSIIAIDEPEAHLHPGAIRQLNSVLQGLVSNNQVIISTHNPLFINKIDIKANVIVSSGKASPAKDIKEVRDTLGVSLSDNLMSCNFKIFVEGLSDKRIIEKLLCVNSDIKNALNNSQICVESLRGASNLTSKLYESNNMLFDYYVFIDGDTSGKDAYNDANGKNLIDLSKITFASCPGKKESELEDLIIPDIYLNRLNQEFGTNINNTQFNSMKKWSDQLKQLFLDEGKLWNKDIEEQVKTIVADELCKNVDLGNEVFIAFRKMPIDSFMSNIKKVI